MQANTDRIQTTHVGSLVRPPELVEFMRGHGRKKVLFGSNFPMITPAECLADLDALGLPADARAMFLGENAARVFRL